MFENELWFFFNVFFSEEYACRDGRFGGRGGGRNVDVAVSYGHECARGSCMGRGCRGSFTGMKFMDGFCSWCGLRKFGNGGGCMHSYCECQCAGIDFGMKIFFRKFFSFDGSFMRECVFVIIENSKLFILK
jgi:hypothetical protein